MIEISFSKKNRKPIQVPKGEELMDALLKAEIPVASSCHGDGVCAKCRVLVTEGMQNLSSPNDTEIFLKKKFQLNDAQRISCQTHVLGPVEIDTTYW